MAPELASLIGKTYLFKVETKADFSPRFEQSFRVRKICLDPAIIKEFMSKWNKEDASFSKLTNVRLIWIVSFLLNSLSYCLIVVYK